MPKRYSPDTVNVGCRIRLGWIFRYGQPQSTDVETGATYRRQYASEADPPISANGHYV